MSGEVAQTDAINASLNVIGGMNPVTFELNDLIDLVLELTILYGRSDTINHDYKKAYEKMKEEDPSIVGDLNTFFHYYYIRYISYVGEMKQLKEYQLTLPTKIEYFSNLEGIDKTYDLYYVQLTDFVSKIDSRVSYLEKIIDGAASTVRHLENSMNKK